MFDKDNEMTSRRPSDIWEKTAGIRSAVSDIPMTRDSDIDPLQSYLKDIGELPVPSAERQAEIIEDMIAADVEIRSALGSMGLVMQEHIRLLSGYQDEAELAALFLPSSVPENTDIITEAWKHHRALVNFYEKWQALYRKKSPELNEYRVKAVELLNKMPFSSEYMENCYQLLVDYKNFDFNKKDWMVNFLEDKVFMPYSDFLAVMQRLEVLRRSVQRMRQELLVGNLRLVISVANQYNHPNVSKNDLIQEGNIGLMRALEKFDFRLGNRFSTFATWWIRQCITRAIAEQGTIIRLPRHIINTIRAIRQAEQRYILEHGSEPDNKDIARMLEMPEPRVSAIRKMAKQTLSLQAQIGDADGRHLEDVIADESSKEEISEISEMSLKDTIKAVLGELTAREQQIIILRFGLFEQRAQTLEEISRSLGLTRERVRQLEAKIIAKMRKSEILKSRKN